MNKTGTERKSMKVKGGGGPQTPCRPYPVRDNSLGLCQYPVSSPSDTLCVYGVSCLSLSTGPCLSRGSLRLSVPLLCDPVSPSRGPVRSGPSVGDTGREIEQGFFWSYRPERRAVGGVVGMGSDREGGAGDVRV